MRIIELCAGYGGLGLGVQIAIPSARVVCVVERQAYTIARWRELVEAEALEPMAIWPDVESFAWAMAQRNRKRLGLQLPQCDMLTAGFPCQPFSQAGKRRGIKDERWIWPAIRRAIGVLGPRYVFLENVAGILNAGGFGRVLGDLSALGFNAEWDTIPAADAGANHFRFRVFIFAWRRDDADAGRQRMEGRKPKRQRHDQYSFGGDVRSAAAQHALCERCGGVQEHQGPRAAERGRDQAADATDARRQQEQEPTGAKFESGTWPTGCGQGDATDATGRGFASSGQPSGSDGLATGGGPNDGHAIGTRLQIEQRQRTNDDPQFTAAKRTGEQWPGRNAGPATSGVDDGATEGVGEGWWSDCPYPPEQWLSRDEPDRAEQLHALGNGVVPLQAALALTLLTRRAGVTL